ncbi:hypothetical protein GCM10010387_51020 [Streptomyces inusitatus]|uniref:DUF4394 domain-containing protein n=1 Tax=Streptomyces inusitatus TaxID=68221 RepID=A0A918V0V0_9ACTN|nr:DUF4394 domain-containing protein [Streptomyces inusitatus]GGZ50573.1 hypothetical protein GCM10010387_51020 [Streptomyces inusitatus]
MRNSVATAAVCLAALTTPALALAEPAAAPAASRSGAAAPRTLSALGLTADQRLVRFAVDKPSATRTLGRISGLTGDTKLVGIDFRVQNLKLYGVGDQGGVYTLDTTNATATKVSQLTVALSGALFGVDFNPAANRLRVISDTGQNLRHNIDDATGAPGTVADGPLINPTVPPTAAQGVTAAAYTNNDLDTATATTLFDIDTLTDRVDLQSPANSGSLAPTGGLGVDAGPDAGFDIYFSPADGSNHGFAALRTGTSHRLYEVGVLTGAVRDLGSFPARRQVTDIALPLAQH